jgi:hypothetical protein
MFGLSAAKAEPLTIISDKSQCAFFCHNSNSSENIENIALYNITGKVI